MVGGAAVLAGIIERRIAGDIVGLVGIGAMADQQPHHLQVAPLDREDERRLAAAVAEIGVGAAGEQLLGALAPADLGGEDQRRGAVLALDVGPGAAAEHEAEPAEVAAAHQDMERAFAGRGLAMVDRGRARPADDLFRRRAVALAHRLEEGEALRIAHLLRRERRRDQRREGSAERQPFCPAQRGDRPFASFGLIATP